MSPALATPEVRRTSGRDESVLGRGVPTVECGPDA